MHKLKFFLLILFYRLDAQNIVEFSKIKKIPFINKVELCVQLFDCPPALVQTHTHESSPLDASTPMHRATSELPTPNFQQPGATSTQSESVSTSPRSLPASGAAPYSSAATDRHSDPVSSTEQLFAFALNPVETTSFKKPPTETEQNSGADRIIHNPMQTISNSQTTRQTQLTTNAVSGAILKAVNGAGASAGPTQHTHTSPANYTDFVFTNLPKRGRLSDENLEALLRRFKTDESDCFSIRHRDPAGRTALVHVKNAKSKLNLM